MNVHILQPDGLTLNALRTEYRAYRQHLEPDLLPSQRATHFVVEIEPAQERDARMLPGYVPIEAFSPLARKHSPDFTGALGFCENYWIVVRLEARYRDHRFPPLFSLNKRIPEPAGPTLKFRRHNSLADAIQESSALQRGAQAFLERMNQPMPDILGGRLPRIRGGSIVFRRYTPPGDTTPETSASPDIGDALAMALVACATADDPFGQRDYMPAYLFTHNRVELNEGWLKKPLPAEILSDLGTTKTVGLDMGAPGGDQTVCIRMPGDDVLRAAMERRREQYGLRIDTIRCEVINQTRLLRDINERHFAMTSTMPAWRKLFGYTERQAIQKALSRISQTAAFKRLPTTLKPLP